MHKFNTLCFIFFFSIVSSFAESWFVCLGSFTIEDNAKKFVKVLKNKGFEANIDKKIINDILHHRVLLLLDFDDVKTAREKRDILMTQKGIVALKLKDLWVCVPSDEFYQDYQNNKVGHHLLEKPILLKENAIIPLSKKTPYSILVGKYKEESVAENNAERLKKDGFDAYVIKTYDDKEYFSFNVNVSAFEEEEEALNVANELKERGIHVEGISNYEKMKESIANYNSVVKNKNVNMFLGNNDIPSVFSPTIQDSIKEFPINKDFQIESIYIFDLENIRKYNNYNVNMDIINDLLLNKDKTHVASIAFYKDNLFDKNISILLQKGEKGAYEIEETEKDAFLTLHTASGNLHCVLKEENEYLHLLGINEDGSTFIKMKSNSFSSNEFNIFLNNISNDSSLLIYPEIRKSLLVLPKENAECKRDFLSFSLEKVEPCYAKEKDYASWAIPIVGHWKAKGYFNINNKMASISFFDMDYDYNASSIHNMFMESNKKRIIDSNNRPIALKRIKGWFVKGLTSMGGEVSFSIKSYIIAVHAYNNSFDTHELVRLGDDLQIWK